MLQISAHVKDQTVDKHPPLLSANIRIFRPLYVRAYLKISVIHLKKKSRENFITSRTASLNRRALTSSTVTLFSCLYFLNPNGVNHVTKNRHEGTGKSKQTGQNLFQFATGTELH